MLYRRAVRRSVNGGGKSRQGKKARRASTSRDALEPGDVGSIDRSVGRLMANEWGRGAKGLAAARHVLVS